jgi:hypothetical protein
MGGCSSPAKTWAAGVALGRRSEAVSAEGDGVFLLGYLDRGHYNSSIFEKGHYNSSNRRYAITIPCLHRPGHSLHQMRTRAHYQAYLRTGTRTSVK